MDLDTLGEEEPNLDSLNIEMKLGNAKLAGEAENVKGTLDLDLTEILNNVWTMNTVTAPIERQRSIVI